MFNVITLCSDEPLPLYIVFFKRCLKASEPYFFYSIHEISEEIAFNLHTKIYDDGEGKKILLQLMLLFLLHILMIWK